MKVRLVIGGLGWSAAATVVNLLAQFGFAAVLARQVDAAAFGLMAMASIGVRFASYFSQMGTGQTLVQRPTLEPAFASAALWGALGVSAILYALMALLAPLLAWSFRSPELVPVIWALGGTLMLGPGVVVTMALLRRDGHFAQASAIEVGSFVFGYGITGVAAASQGLGVWSLVLATLAQQALCAGLGFAAVRYPWLLPRRGDPVWREAMGSGGGYSVLGFLEFVWANVEALAIGRLLGQAPLGLFNRAQMLANQPVEQVVGTVNKVIFPALSALAGERQRMADGFLVLLLVTGMVASTVAAGIAAAAPDVVALLLGRRWGETVPLLVLTCAMVPALLGYSICGVTLDSLSALGPKLRLQGLLIPVKAALVLAASRHGLVAMLLAGLVSEYLRLGVGVWAVHRHLVLPRQALLQVLVACVAAAAAPAAAITLLRACPGVEGLPLLWRLALQTVAGLVALAALAGVLVHQARHFAPLQQFETLVRWQQRAHLWLYRRAAEPTPSG